MIPSTKPTKWQGLDKLTPSKIDLDFIKTYLPKELLNYFYRDYLEIRSLIAQRNVINIEYKEV